MCSRLLLEKPPVEDAWSPISEVEHQALMLRSLTLMAVSQSSVADIVFPVARAEANLELMPAAHLPIPVPPGFYSFRWRKRKTVKYCRRPVANPIAQTGSPET